MDIEIRVRTGKRSTNKNGEVTWKDAKDSGHLITYSVDELGAIREALRQLERMLRDSLKSNPK